MVTAGMLPRAAVREVEARLRAAGCPDADFDAAELFWLHYVLHYWASALY